MAKGGTRANAGRPKGRKDDSTLAYEEAAKRVFEAHKPKDGELTSLELFRAVYRSDEFSMSARLKAAAEALPYEHPKLQAIQHSGDVPDGSGQAAVGAIELARELAFLLRQASEPRASN